jgi:transglutaminase-like putative cysteine protease
MMATTAARLWTTDWTPRLGLAQTAAFLGSVLGLVLGYSLFQRGRVWLVALGYSLIVLPWIWMGVVTAEESALQRLASVGGRLAYAFTEIAARKPVEDFIFFVAVMTIILWVMGLAGGYQLARRAHLLAAAIPPGLGIVVLEIYDSAPEANLYLAIYLLLCLMLIGRHNLIRISAAWQARNMALSSEAGVDIATGVVFTSAALIMAAWFLPTNGYALAPVRQTWEAIDKQFASTRRAIQDAFSAVENYVPGGGTEAYGPELALGRSAAQGDALLFTVAAPAGRAPRYYWRARTYDIYRDGTWSNSRMIERAYAPDDDLFDLSGRAAAAVTMTVSINRTQGTLIAVNDPLWFSRPAAAFFAHTGADSQDVITVLATEKLRAGDRYEMRSAIPAATIAAMRSAGTDYPAWIKEQYLQLPANLPAKIASLAAEITASANTPYDKADAITNYLRAEITYTLSIQSSDPLGGDPMAWMLFNSKEGFCNYYASAAVLMLRAVGVPARMAVGYAQGESDAPGRYTVRVEDSHAWPEVYFPGLGWVEFEPTTAQPGLVRPSGAAAALSPGSAPQPDLLNEDPAGRETADDEGALPATTGFQFSRRVLLWVIIFVVGGATAVVLLGLSRRVPITVRIPRALARMFVRNNLNIPRWVQDWLRWTEQTPAERSFETINLCLRILRQPQPIHATPGERATALSGLVPEAHAAIEQLAQQHILALFGRAPEAAREAWRAILSIYFFTLRHYFRSTR